MMITLSSRDMIILGIILCIKMLFIPVPLLSVLEYPIVVLLALTFTKHPLVCLALSLSVDYIILFSFLQAPIVLSYFDVLCEILKEISPYDYALIGGRAGVYIVYEIAYLLAPMLELYLSWLLVKKLGLTDRFKRMIAKGEVRTG